MIPKFHKKLLRASILLASIPIGIIHLAFSCEVLKFNFNVMKNLIFISFLSFLILSGVEGCSNDSTNPVNPDPPVADSTVQLVSPPDDTVIYSPPGLVVDTVKFTWHKTFNVDSYWFQISFDSTFSSSPMYLVDDTSYSTNIQFDDITKYWRVRVRTSIMPPVNYWSNTRHFTPVYQP